MSKGFKHFIVAAYTAETGKTSTLWIVTTVPNDTYQSGDTIAVNGKEYILGKRDIDSGEVSSYELILKNEVLEL